MDKIPQEDVRRAAADLVEAPRLRVVEALNLGLRTDVWRMAEGDRTWVVKAYHEPDTGTWRREFAGLTAAGGRGAPQPLAVSADPPVVVMTDLGTGVSLADRLLADDATAAQTALIGWAQAIAQLHLDSQGGRAEFDRTLVRLGAGAETGLATGDARGFGYLDQVTCAHDLPPAGVVQDAYAALEAPLLDEQTWLLSPGDVCPDNNLDLGDRVVLLDFEFAEFRHPAWDLAYLRVPWPSCWCAWGLPARQAEAALTAYRASVAGQLSWADDEQVVTDLVDRAALAFCLLSVGWFLPRALEEDGDEATERRPGRRTRILSRLALVAGNGIDPALGAYAAELATALRARWGEAPLALAPAFR